MTHRESLKKAHLFFPNVHEGDTEITVENCKGAINLDTYGEELISSLDNVSAFDQTTDLLDEISSTPLYIASVEYLRICLPNAKYCLVMEYESTLDMAPVNSVDRLIMPITDEYDIGTLLANYLLKFEVSDSQL